MAKNTVYDWDTVASNNQDIAGISILATAPVSNMDDALRELMAQAASGFKTKLQALTSVASASTTNIGAAASEYVSITGTTSITSFGTAADGTMRGLVFQNVLTLTHDSVSLILPGAANIRTASGDTAVFVSEGGGKWRCLNYQRSDGQPVAGASIGSVSTGYNISLGDRGDLITVDATSGNKAINLPLASVAGNGFIVSIRKDDASANAAILVASGSDNIDGQASIALRSRYQVITVISDGTSSWAVLSCSDLSIKAFVKFNGSTGSIFASRNISSVTRTAAGSYTLNFATSLVDTNYTAVMSSDQPQGNIGAYATNSLAIVTRNSTGALADGSTVNAIVMR